MIEVQTETSPPEPDVGDEGEDRPLLSVRFSITELDDAWNTAEVMLQEAQARDPDQVADAIVVALQRRLANWGTT